MSSWSSVSACGPGALGIGSPNLTGGMVIDRLPETAKFCGGSRSVNSIAPSISAEKIESVPV
jgi:hypothetical protein